jgi:type I restriction enzyme, R subunit
MNEAETRAELIDPQLKEAGWGVVENSRILRERHITDGRIQAGGKRSKPLIADYILQYNNRNIGVVEAKSSDLGVSEGVMQAKEYAKKLSVNFTYAANGKEIYEMSTLSGEEGKVTKFPTPDELWERTFSAKNEWKDRFNSVPMVSYDGTSNIRYYIESATNKVLDAIADDKQRILLTLATGTGKTFLAFQIAWKLFKSRWNLKKDGSRQPRILFLADRNVLANQAYNEFHRFPEDALIRIKPNEIKKTGKVPTNGSIFFSIFQTFMSGKDDTPYFGEYPKDFFDFIVIDECHRGGANDESSWRDILEYFSPAVQLGLTATPKRNDNADTYKYFGEPVYIYSLKEGINDGFLTPFKAKIIEGMMSEYTYDSGDDVEEGEVENKTYTEKDFNTKIMIPERERKRVEYLLQQMNQNEKTIVFCATQRHAAEIRDYINQLAESTDTNYCVRVTAEDGSQGDQYLEDFQNNEKNIPTILTTSQKLSTGVDARNVRNIVLLRPVNSMIEFKQIIGRGTRLFDGKDYFTIYDYVDACKLFEDPEWDGDPIDPTPSEPRDPKEPHEDPLPPEDPEEPKQKIKIKLAEGKLIEIRPIQSTLFMDASGKTLTVHEFIKNLYGQLPKHFKDEGELQKIWSNPKTREKLLKTLAEEGYGTSELEELQKIVDAENSDLFDVLEYISFNIKPIARIDRVEKTSENILNELSIKEKEFIEFVLDKYIDAGFGELDEEKIPTLLELKYGSLFDAKKELGEVENIRKLFFNFQKDLYALEAN